jgi:gamma-glutamyltranspeptidase/glutathione hydrolase
MIESISTNQFFITNTFFFFLLNQTSTVPHSNTKLENRFPKDSIEHLKKIGHNVEIQGPWDGKGSEGMICISREGLLGAAVDPRRDGQAIVW